MPDPDDDAALRWGGEHDPSHVDAARPVPRETPATADGAAGEPAGDARASSVGLVGLGILAGVYLLYTVGWVLSVVQDQFTLTDPLAQAMATVGDVLAVLAPALWFAAIHLLTRGRSVARFAWLIGGAVLLIPWPFVLGGLA